MSLPPQPADERAKSSEIEPTHPIGTALGGVGIGVAGAVAGAVAGSLIGPAGTVIGGALGAVAGAVLGTVGARVSGSVLNPEEEEDYWENSFADRDYFIRGMTWADYCPAYRLGVKAHRDHPDVTFEQAEGWLSQEWPMARKTSRLTWEEARPAVADAWERVGRRL